MLNRLTTLLWISAALLLIGCGAEQPAATDAPSVITDDEPPVSTISCPPLSEPDGEGPFYLEGAPFKENLAPDGADGDLLIVSGIVYMREAEGCVPLADAVVDVWHADVNGEYDMSDEFLYRGKVRTDASGRYEYETILPTAYEGRPAHIHYRVTHPDARDLTTQLYFEGDPVLGGATAADSTRVVQLLEEDGIFRAVYDLVLSPR